MALFRTFPIRFTGLICVLSTVMATSAFAQRDSGWHANTYDEWYDRTVQEVRVPLPNVLRAHHEGQPTAEERPEFAIQQVSHERASHQESAHQQVKSSYEPPDNPSSPVYTAPRTFVATENYRALRRVPDYHLTAGEQYADATELDVMEPELLPVGQTVENFVREKEIADDPNSYLYQPVQRRRQHHYQQDYYQSIQPGRYCDDCVEDTKPWLEWKSTNLSGTWLPGDDDDLGLTDFKVGGQFGFRDLPLLTISPSYQMFFLNGGSTNDIPDRLFAAKLDFSWFMPLSKRWRAIIGVTPGLYGDFQSDSHEVFRVTGRGMAFFQWTHHLQLILGVVYLNREDVSVVPAVGLVYQPTDYMKYEFVFPRPRYSHRVWMRGDKERWWYFGGEFGGGTYAVERTGGADDEITIRDFRILTGLETKHKDGRNWFAEAGIVFGRDVEFETGPGDFSPDETIFLRMGITF